VVATPALTVPTTALGDLVRAQYTPPRSRRLTTNAVRMIAVLSIVLVAAGAIGATTAHAWFLDDAVSRIANFCSPNDVVTPSNSFGGLDGAFGLNSFDENNIEGQKTILPNAGGYYDDGATIDANYYRYGFSALKLHSYGTGCGNLVARYIPGLYNIALTLFVYIPVALTMLMVNLALGSTLGAFFSTLLSPLFIALSQVMKPIVTILAPFGTLYAFVKYRERVGKVAAAGIYALVCAGFVYWGANGNSGALQKIVESSDKIVSGAVGTVTSQIADSMFPPVSSASKGDSGTSITYGQASGAKNNNSKPAMSINNSLWKGIPLATWSTAQMGPEMTEAAASNSDKDQAKPWQNRLLNANHIGMASSNKVDNEGLIMLAGVEAWNSRSYAINGQDTKTDAWTEGWDAEVDGEVAAKKPSVWQTVPQLADAGTLCHDRFHVPDGKGSGKAEHNRWMFNGSCVPEDNDAAWIDYYKGTSWPETGSVIMTGAMGAILVMIVCLPVAFYVALQKALMYWLLIFSVVFIGIASFGDEKRQRFAKAYFGEFFSSIMKQVGAVAALVILSYMVAAIIMSPGIPAIIKPMMVLILGSSLWLLALIARKIAKAAIAGDASIVHSTARAPVTAAKTDEAALDLLPKLDGERKFYVVHLMGNHMSYSKRYPAEFGKFSEVDVENPKLDATQRKIVSQYLNSVLYNDFVVSEIFKRFAGEDSLVIYLSDHAESLYEYKNKLGHGFASRFTCEIPMIIYGSDEFIAAHPKIWAALSAAKDAPFMSDDLAHALADIIGVKPLEYDAARSLISGEFNASRKRIVQDVDYEKMRRQKAYE